MNRLIASISGFVMLFGCAQGGAATELPKEAGPARTAKMFDMLCLGVLPDIEQIARIAEAGSFTELSGSAVQAYQAEVPAEQIRVWKFPDFGAEFTLIATQSKPDDEFKKEVPEFANSTNYACSLLTPGKDEQEAVLGQLGEIIGRSPDENWDQGPLDVHSWIGQNDKFRTQVFHYAAAKGGKSSVLSAATFVKTEQRGATPLSHASGDCLARVPPRRC